MGEYGYTEDGERIKLGTCEDMYYLRPDQIPLVRAEGGLFAHLDQLRFRFPFPHEDKCEPGEFENPFYGFRVDIEPPEDDELHSDVQFKDTHNNGILVMLPCPRSAKGKASGLRYGYNGYQGPARIVQQRAWEGVWATVMRCGDCEGIYRLPTLDDALPVIEALIKEGDHRVRLEERARTVPGQEVGDTAGRTWYEMALRVRRGYETPVEVKK